MNPGDLVPRRPWITKSKDSCRDEKLVRKFFTVPRVSRYIDPLVSIAPRSLGHEIVMVTYRPTDRGVLNPLADRLTVSEVSWLLGRPPVLKSRSCLSQRACKPCFLRGLASTLTR